MSPNSKLGGAFEMVEQRSTAAKARTRARELLAERVAARRAAERANEVDLAELLRLMSDIAANDETRERGIASARAAFDDAAAKVRAAHVQSAERIRAAQSECINRLRGRGESPADIAALTGMTAIEIGRLGRSAMASTNGASHPTSTAKLKTSHSDRDREIAADGSPSPSSELY